MVVSAGLEGLGRELFVGRDGRLLEECGQTLLEVGVAEDVEGDRNGAAGKVPLQGVVGGQDMFVLGRCLEDFKGDLGGPVAPASISDCRRGCRRGLPFDRRDSQSHSVDQNGGILPPDVKHQGLGPTGSGSGERFQLREETGFVDSASLVDAARCRNGPVDGVPGVGCRQSSARPDRQVGMDSSRCRKHEAASGDQPGRDGCLDLVDVGVLGPR